MNLREQLFAQNAVAELSDKDFNKDHTCLKHKDCVLVLFCNTSLDVFKELIKTWTQAAQETVGPVFGISNSSFQQPKIISYQDGKPVDQYTGPVSVDNIINYSLGLDINSVGTSFETKNTDNTDDNLYNLRGVKVKPQPKPVDSEIFDQPKKVYKVISL